MIIVNNWWKEKNNEIRKNIKEKFKHSSFFATTTIKKIILNSGIKDFKDKNKKILEKTVEAFQKITEQKPKITKANRSIINFGLQKGTSIGCMVTLRKKKAYDFLFQLINIALPRIGNFRGLSKKNFDKWGNNCSWGIEDLNIFPSVPYDLSFNQGCQITIVFHSRSTVENIYYLESLRFPFNK